MIRDRLVSAAAFLTLGGVLAACSTPAPPTPRAAPPAPPTLPPPEHQALVPPETAAPQPAMPAAAPEPAPDLETTRQLAAAVVATIAAVETDQGPRFGVIAMGQTVALIRQLGAVELYHVEWHGNPVGDRWKRADVATCHTCEGYAVGSLDLLDGHVFRAEIQVDPQPRPTTARADALCEAIRTQLADADGRVGAGKCTCSAPAPQDEISRWSLPGPDDSGAPPCDPVVESLFHFTVEVPKAVDDIPRATGTVSVSRSSVQVKLMLYGQHYRRLLDAKRALNSRTYPVP